MTVHARATDIALSELSDFWSVGHVLMNQNCPDYLRTDEPNLDRDTRHLAKQFGQRLVITDRFAVAVNSDLRRRASSLARDLGLRTQTHLNEQQKEKHLVEQELYPGQSYAGVYKADGLLDHACILAHCIWMTADEWSIARDTNSVIAHCPTSNALLGSGVMRLDEVRRKLIPYALCTDVGASPTPSLLCEMAEFLAVHAKRNLTATAEEALFRCTLAPAHLLGLDQTLGSFAPGKSLSYIEINPAGPIVETTAEAVIRNHLLELPTVGFPAYQDLRNELAQQGLSAPKDMDALAADFSRTVERLKHKVRQVVVAGQQLYSRPTA
jgi:guanine deaminase